MEKISKIIPASTRQVLSFGEVERPRRTTEPNAPVASVAQTKEDYDFASEEIGKAVVERGATVGSKLDAMA